MTPEELLEMSLEQLLTVKVTTTSKRAETRADAPGVFSVITAEETIGVFNSLFGRPRANHGERLNPDAGPVDLLSANVNYRLSAAPSLELNVFAQNLLNDPYHYTEFQRSFVNTLPLSPGRVVFGSVAVRL